MFSLPYFSIFFSYFSPVFFSDLCLSCLFALQIGMMRCLGITRFAIVRLFIEEAFVLVGTAVLIGTSVYA
jgi:hypothetical protein